MKGRDLEFYENQPVPDKDVQELMDDEIAHAPQAPHELAQRLTEHHSTSPADSGRSEGIRLLAAPAAVDETRDDLSLAMCFE